MVQAVRQGSSPRAVARRFGVSHNTVRLWVARAGRQRLDRVDWGDRPSGCRRARNRTAREMEDLVLQLRRELHQNSALGEFGAAAIDRALGERGLPQRPSIRTIGRILERHGALDGRHRVRRPPPPPGWYLPQVAAGEAELDSFDVLEGLALRGGLTLEVLNGVSLHGGLPASWVQRQITAKRTVDCLLQHWRQFGLPGYAQFDNDTIFQGAHQWADSFGRVIRLCLQLEVVPVFAPPRETGFQAAIENYNGRWQSKVWHRFVHPSLPALEQCSDRFVGALRQRLAARIEAAPARRSFPGTWHLDWQRSLRGKVIFLRRTTERGAVHLLGHLFPVDPHWTHRLVRAVVDFQARHVRFFALRRREPAAQPLLQEANYEPKPSRFHA